MVSAALVLLAVTGLVYWWRNGSLSLVWQAIQGNVTIA